MVTLGHNMHILICIKQIIGPEAPAEKFKLDRATGRLRAEDVAQLVACTR